MSAFDKYIRDQTDLLLKKADNLERRPQRVFVYNVTILTIYGFQVAVPVVLAIFLGIFLDRICDISHFSWTLNCILIGFCVGFYNANRWFYNAIELHKHKKHTRKKKA